MRSMKASDDLWTPKRAAIAVAASIVLAVAIWLAFFRTGDEARIRAQLTRLSAVVRIDATATNPIIRNANLKDGFAELMTRDVSIDIPELAQLPGSPPGGTTSGRAGLADIVTAGSSWYRTFDVSFSSIRIGLDAQANGAHVTAKATVDAARQDGVSEHDSRDVSFDFTTREGGWRIARLVVAPRESGGQ